MKVTKLVNRAFYFTVHNNLIVQLIILRNRSDI